MLKAYGSASKLLLLLGQRKGETLSMRWSDIQENTWIIPAHRTKANRKHKVPLPPVAVKIIEELENNTPYVFESNCYPGEPVKWLQRSFTKSTENARIKDVRIHDLRRTAATYMAELGTDRTILGKVLNHKGLAGDSQVTARYDRYAYRDEKQTALNRWSHKLKQIIEASEAKIHKIG